MLAGFGAGCVFPVNRFDEDPHINWKLLPAALGFTYYNNFDCHSSLLNMFEGKFLWLCGPFAGPWPIIWFLNYLQNKFLGLAISPLQGLYLHTGQHKQNKRARTSIPRMGFEPPTRTLERAKSVHALDHWYSTFFIGVPPHVISLQPCTHKVDGV
jgi:hypothetical protein